MTTARDHRQDDALEKLRASLASGRRRPVLQAPTGFGKTRVASKIINRALAKDRRLTFTVPALSLIDQAVQDFWDEGIRDVGVIQSNHAMTDWSKPVQIASVQTLMRREYPESDLVLIDECHRWFDVYEKWMADPAWWGKPFIGLSATPWAKGLGNYFDDLIVAGTVSDGISEGWLSPFRVFGPRPFDVSGVKQQGGDYVASELSKAVNKVELVADVVETWIRLGENRPTFCFAVDLAHAKALHERYEICNIKSAYQDAETSSADRKDLKRAFHNREIDVVCSVGTMTTGIDWDVRCISMARPTKSEILMTQMLGRGLRTADGKKDCLFLDHTTNHDELGYVTDIGYSELSTKLRPKPKRILKFKLPKRCPKCSFMKSAGTHVCPECGFAPQEQVTPRDIDMRDGELEELTKQGGTCKVSARVIEMRGRQIPLSVFWGALLSYATEKNYKIGWVYHKYEKAVGTPANGISRSPACQIPDEVSSWIRSQQIAWAKSKTRKRVREDARETA